MSSKACCILRPRRKMSGCCGAFNDARTTSETSATHDVSTSNPSPRRTRRSRALPSRVSLSIFFVMVHLSRVRIFAAAASRSSELFLSPIKELGPSLAASVAASTVIAVTAPSNGPEIDLISNTIDDKNTNEIHTKEEEGEKKERPMGECCLIVTKSFAENNPSDGDEDDVDIGLTISAIARSDAAKNSKDVDMTRDTKLTPLHPGRYSPSLSILSTHPSPLILGITGFSPDAHHLTLSAAQMQSEHRWIYGGSAQRTDRLVQGLAGMVAEAAMSGGGRPFGVQALVVGDRLGTNEKQIGEMQLYTIDPTGGYRHWSGGATAVGRGADITRKCLERCLRPNKRQPNGTNQDKFEGRGPPSNWREALDRAIMATIEASTADLVDEGRYEDVEFAKAGRYRAVAAFSRGLSSASTSQPLCFEISEEAIQESFERCAEWLRKEEDDRDIKKNRRIKG